MVIDSVVSIAGGARSAEVVKCVLSIMLVDSQEGSAFCKVDESNACLCSFRR